MNNKKEKQKGVKYENEQFFEQRNKKKWDFFERNLRNTEKKTNYEILIIPLNYNKPAKKIFGIVFSPSRL